MHSHYYFGDYSTYFHSLAIMTSQWKLGLICTCGVYPATRSCWCKRCSCGWYCKKADLFDLREDMLRIKPKFAVRFPTCLSWAVDTKLIFLAFRNSRRHMTKLRKLSQSWSLKIRFVSYCHEQWIPSWFICIQELSASYDDATKTIKELESQNQVRIRMWHWIC